jgi:tripartite-type tricarboxylate transporter receptor subunit TctC
MKPLTSGGPGASIGDVVTAVATIGVAMALSLPGAQAQDWPSRPVRIIVGNPPGGSADRFGRLLASALSRTLKQQFVVENKPGNSAAIASLMVAHSEPDGYTLQVGASGPHVSAPLFGDVGYDPVADFTHIAMIGGDSYVLAANKTVGVTSLAGLLAAARARKDPFTYATPGANSLGGIILEQFRRQAGIEVQPVPYRGGGTAAQDVLGQHVDFAMLPVATLGGALHANMIAPLAVTSRDRNPVFKDIPTFIELGYPDVFAETWFWLAGPKHLPQPIVQKLYQETGAALKTPEVVRQFETEALVARDVASGGMDGFVAEEIAHWRAVMKAVGLNPR